jgi:hypothetical protein
VPFEVISMIEALESGVYSGAYIVLGGNAWRYKEFYLRGGLDRHVPKARLVQILTLEEFITKANQGKL